MFLFNNELYGDGLWSFYIESSQHCVTCSRQRSFSEVLKRLVCYLWFRLFQSTTCTQFCYIRLNIDHLLKMRFNINCRSDWALMFRKNCFLAEFFDTSATSRHTSYFIVRRFGWSEDITSLYDLTLVDVFLSCASCGGWVCLGPWLPVSKQSM